MRRTLGTLLVVLMAAGGLAAAATLALGREEPPTTSRASVGAATANIPRYEVESPTGEILEEMTRRQGTPGQVARVARARALHIKRVQALRRRLARLRQQHRVAAAARAAATLRAATMPRGDPDSPYWWDPAAASVPNRRPSTRAEQQWLASGRGGWVAADGYARAPSNAPDAVRRVIQAGNLIARSPYEWGGGHGAWRDKGYDCSGSVSYALAAGGMLGWSQTSGQLMSWGAPGPGRWITIYANGGHVFMVVAGLRFDTSGRRGDRASRWQLAPRSTAGFAVRHYPGL